MIDAPDQRQCSRPQVNTHTVVVQYAAVHVQPPNLHVDCGQALWHGAMHHRQRHECDSSRREQAPFGGSECWGLVIAYCI